MNTVTGAALGDDNGTHSPLPPADVPLAGSALLGAWTDTYRIDDAQYEPWLSWRSCEDDAEPTATSRWINSIGKINHQTVVAPKVARSAAEDPIRGYPPAWNKAADTSTFQNLMRGYPPQEALRAAPAEAGFDPFAIDWTKVKLNLPRRGRWGEIRPYRVFEAAAGRHRQGRAAIISPRRLTAAAVFLAGRKRSAVHDEWRSHLSGWTGRGLAREEQIRAARGFLWSAVRYRSSDAAGLVGRGFDAVLRSRSMSDLTVWVPVLLAMLAVVRHDGPYGLVTYDLNLIELGVGIYGAIRYGRRRRGVKPAKRKPGQASKKLPLLFTEASARSAAASTGLFRAGRWGRDAKPPEPDARRAKEQ